MGHENADIRKELWDACEEEGHVVRNVEELLRDPDKPFVHTIEHVQHEAELAAEGDEVADAVRQALIAHISRVAKES